MTYTQLAVLTGAGQAEGCRQTVPSVRQPRPQQSTHVAYVIVIIVTATEAFTEPEQELGTSQCHQRHATLQPTHQSTLCVSRGPESSKYSACESGGLSPQITQPVSQVV